MSKRAPPPTPPVRQAAAITFTLHDKFSYKGTPNDDIAKYSAMLELSEEGSWKIVHAHRASGQKPAEA